MTEEKRGPGRPPKVRPEAAPALTEQDVVNVKPAPAAERMVEVELKRKYAPTTLQHKGREVQVTVPAGTVIELPIAEATRVLKLGVAVATDRTFG